MLPDCGRGTLLSVSLGTKNAGSLSYSCRYPRQYKCCCGKNTYHSYKRGFEGQAKGTVYLKPVISYDGARHVHTAVGGWSYCIVLLHFTHLLARRKTDRKKKYQIHKNSAATTFSCVHSATTDCSFTHCSLRRTNKDLATRDTL